MNRLCLTLLLVGTLAACVQSPPRSNPWADKAVAFEPAARPVALPEWPELSACGERLCITAAEADQILNFAEVADANYEIGVELASAVDELAVSYNALVKAGSAEYELSELRGATLDAERKARIWEKLGSWSLIVLLGIGAAR